MHQGSALSLLLFVIVMEALSGQFQVAMLCHGGCVCVDDLIVIAKTEDGLDKRLGGWRDGAWGRYEWGQVVISGNWRRAVGWPVLCLWWGRWWCAGCQRWVHGGVMVWGVACMR